MNRARLSSFRSFVPVVLLVTGGVLLWLGWRGPEPVSALSDATGEAAVARPSAPAPVTVSDDTVPEAVRAQIPAEEAALAKRVQARVEQIRAAQVQLRAGAEPEEVREPVLPEGGGPLPPGGR